jgi:hypothetical protein
MYTMGYTMGLQRVSHTYISPIPQGVHSSSTVNIHVREQKGYYLEQACTKCTYKRHIAIKQEVDIHEAGDKAIEKYM